MSKMTVFKAAMWTCAASYMLLGLSFLMHGPASDAIAGVSSVVGIIGCLLIIRHFVTSPPPWLKPRAGLEWQ